jgi:hypothetical protein
MPWFKYASGAVRGYNSKMHRLGHYNFSRRCGSKKGLLLYLGFVCAVFWGVGTSFNKTPWIEAYWYVAYGISIGELVFLAILLLVFCNKAWQHRFIQSLSRMKEFVFCISSLAIILTLSTLINSIVYDGSLIDILPCLRLIYFLLVAVFVSAYVTKYGMLCFLFPFILGMVFIALDQLYYAFMSNDAVLVAGLLPMVRSPNVSGAIFGYGIIFCSMAMLHGGRSIVYLLIASLFVFASAFTFSKGSFLMVFFGCFAYFTSFRIRSMLTRVPSKTILFFTIVVIVLFSYLAFVNYNKLESMVRFKIETTENNETVKKRFNLALVGFYAMTEHPLLGLGYKNYPEVVNCYPDIAEPDFDNAHNVFSQVGAVGGVIAFILLIFLFIYPFRLLPHLIPLKIWAGKVYLGATFLVFFLFACVQLQLIAQPVYWVFIGLVSGWKVLASESRQTIKNDPERIKLGIAFKEFYFNGGNQ